METHYCIGKPCVICFPDEFKHIMDELPLFLPLTSDGKRFDDDKIDKMVRMIQEAK